VDLPLQRTSPPRPTLQNLEILLQQTILDVAGFDGVIGLYLSDLQTGDEITLYYYQGEPVPVPPELVFTASSTIKVPILVSALRRVGDTPESEKQLDDTAREKLDAMIAKSDNVASDWVLSNLVDAVTGPLEVTKDMQTVGLNNTFLAGYFYSGAPLLRVINTPGNSRTDLTTEPDRYSQTSPAEIGELLRDIYYCAQNGGGSLIAIFPGEITQAECQMAIAMLKNDRTPWLIPAGVPDGTEVAHKHGWVTDAFGIIHDMSDAGIVYTQGRTYVLSIFLYHPVQLVFDPSNALVVDLSRAVYNFYNIP
jgi:beta-lactamase class A